MAQNNRLSPTVVRAVALWLLAGALFKLLAGSPNDLPSTVQQAFSVFGVARTFKLAISIELAIAIATLLAPRLAWPLIALQMLVFIGVLIPLVLAGEASCGCFGSKIPIPPAVMMAIDGTLLGLMLLTRPWTSIAPERVRWAALLPLVALGVAAPWFLIRTEVKRADPPIHETVEGAAEPADAWTPPTELPRFLPLDPKEWVGKHVRESELHAVVDTSELLDEGTWILWRQSCEHCAEHLRELAAAFDGTQMYTLIRIPGDESETALVDVRPPAMVEIDLPEGTEYVITTPWELSIEEGVVKSALHEELQ
jgi:hypothetical protein